MSGGLGSLTGDSTIALKAGQGVTAPANPLSTVGEFAKTLGAINSTKLQEQQLRGNQMSLAQQMKQLAYSHIAPLVAQGRINSIGELTDALGALEAHGVVTHPILEDMTKTLGMGGDFIGNLKAQTVAGTQPPEKAVQAIAPVPSVQDQGGVLQPMLTPAPGMPGQGVPVPSTAGFQKGYTPGEQLGTVTRPATQTDVDASGGQVQLGQPLMVPATTVPASGGYNPGGGGARVPAGGLGAGGYQAPDLTRLGPAYKPAGTSAPGLAPVSANPAAPNVGSRVMTGPDGKQWNVPADKVTLFQQNGYR